MRPPPPLAAQPPVSRPPVQGATANVETTTIATPEGSVSASGWFSWPKFCPAYLLRLFGILALLCLGTDASAGGLVVVRPHKKIVVCGVTTTIFEPTQSVKTFVQNVMDSMLVVVGDLKTPELPWRKYAAQANGTVIYLSPDKQRSLPFRSVPLLPWNHFGRKNIGFLYAMKLKAEWVFDFDDDNELRPGTWHRDGLLHHLLNPTLHRKHELLTPSTHLYNPYPDFEPVSGKGNGTASFLWPRGFPLDYIHDPRTYAQPAFKRGVSATDVHIYQSLANHNPTWTLSIA